MAETNENLKLTKSVFRKASFWEVGKSGTYENPWEGYKMPSAWNGLTWKFTGTDNSDVPSQEELDETLPIIKPDLNVLKRPPERGLRVTWIGHATVLVQFDSISVLTDPVFSDRCSPCRGFGPKRYRKVPCSIKELPKIDAVVISHTHYDHLDYNSVRELNEKFGKELAWFVPKGLAAWMHSCGCENVKEMDWWDELKLDGKENITFAFTPSQHWCRRGALDYNTVLWGSWCIFGPTKKFFFGGDSGYCDAFKEIGAKYKEGFDLAAIPIGAYEPRWIMKCNHMDPEEAVKTHVDIKARRSVGIHWGTFVMANEYYLEPPTKLKEALLKRELQEEAFFVLKHGESKLIVDEYDNVD